MAHDDDSDAPAASVANVALPIVTPVAISKRATDEAMPMLAIGTRIAERYTIKAVLGAGGMGTVYRALDEELSEEVALKILKGGLAEVEDLRDEVRLAQKVTHPNVCRTYDLEHEGNLQFIKMEYVAGELLAERIRRETKLAVPEAIRIARGIAAGLAAMHAQKIIHRDLKPGNVMVARDGRVVLMDFGLAHKLASKETGVAGTPGYMAPEQLLGETLDERTDYYALGCVLFEMLTGERVFGKGSILEISDRHVEAPIPEVRERRRDVPRWLGRATQALLAKQPEDRSEGIARLAEKPRRPWLIAIPALALGIIAVAVVWIVRGGTPWRPEVIDLPQSEESSDGASLSPDGMSIAWNSNRNGDQFRLYVANVDGTNERMLAAEASYDEPRWTRDGQHLLSSAGNNELQKVPIDNRPPIALGAVGNSPDDCGAGFVFIRYAFDGYRLIYKPYDGAERELLRTYADEWLEKPRCDPSGTKVVFLRGMAPASAFGSDVYVSYLDGKITTLTTDHTAGAATFSSDGTAVIFARREPRISGSEKVQLVELPLSGGTPRQVTFSDGPDSSPDVSRDGSTLVFGREVNLFSIYGGERSGKPRKLSSRRETAYNLRVASPKGEILLAERAHGAGHAVLVIDTVAGTDRVLTPGYLPFPSLDGNTVYFRAVDDPQQLMAIPLAGGPPRKVAKLPGRIVVGTDGPDGQHVMVDEDEHHLVSIRVGAPSPSDRGAGAELTDEGAHWVVPAPSGGWRYWQRPGLDLELRVIAPGKPLGSMDCVFTVESMFNQWLDDHHLAYARTVEVEVGGKIESHDAWYILDVRTCTDDKPSFEVIDVGDHGGLSAVMAPDGRHWFTTKSISRVTRHVANNFGSRPR